jgi:REP element-mobilizing transposase RayT
MSRKYKFRNPSGVYFVSFATVNWIDVFTRPVYKNILVDNLNYCIENKNLKVYAWVIMTNHLHLLISSENGNCSDILRDYKRVTSKALIKAISENMQESRREWMLWMFERAGKKNSNNVKYQFWQQHNQPIDVSDNTDRLEKAIDYIHENPVKSGVVCRAENYLYSSAVDYSGEKGFVNIEKIYE